MKISIALCTYNGSKYLPDQLKSYLDQSRLPDELVVCDDRSSDDTLQILENFKQQVTFPVHIYINEVNLGSTKNFEKAITLCTGDIIIFSDQDDVWLPAKIEKFEKIFHDHPNVGFVSSDLVNVDQNLSDLGTTMFSLLGLSDKLKQAFHSNKGFDILIRKNFFTGASSAFRKSLLEKVVPISKQWVHDGWISIIISVYSGIYIIDEPLTLYRQHASNQIGSQHLAATNGSALFQRIVQSLTIPRHKYLDEVKGLIYLRDHLATVYDETSVLVSTQSLNDKIEHFSVRASLPSSYLSRLPVILSELRARRYQKYSINGVGSAARDIFAILK